MVQVFRNSFSWKVCTRPIAKIIDSGMHEFRMVGLPGTGQRIEEYGTKWTFGLPPALGGRPNSHFVPHFSMRRPGPGNQSMRNLSILTPETTKNESAPGNFCKARVPGETLIN